VSDDDTSVPHPRETLSFFGHADAERALLDAYRSGRMHHAWLIGGPHGIGKATLAYRFARFILAHPSPALAKDATSLNVEPDNTTARRIAARAHPDLLTLERTETDSGTLRTVIRVDDVRRTVGFFGSTAGEGGWRICIVDTADELQVPQAANALLKIIEEPPPRSLFLLVSNAPGRLLPTIRSRCRRLDLRPLAPADVACAAASATGRAADDPTIAAAGAAAGGSVADVLQLIDGDTLELVRRINAMLSELPRVDPQALHALGDALAGTDPAPLAIFVHTVNAWLSQRLRTPSADLPRLARVAEVWEKIAAAARDAETYNLERKPLVFSVFGLLAEAARGSPP